MNQQQTTPTLAQVMSTLDELAAAARAAHADTPGEWLSQHL